MTEDFAYCLYCARRKPPDSFSFECIFPRTLGGHLLDDTFMTNSVCRSCSNFLGLVIDSDFLKSFAWNNDFTADAMRYPDLRRSSPLPLTYLGQLQGLDLPREHVCEVWQSAGKDRILHIHSNHGSYATGNSMPAGIDPGKAIFINTGYNTRWMAAGLESFVKHFERSERVVVLTRFPGEERYRYAGRRPGPDDMAIIGRFIAAYENPARSLKCRHPVRIDCYERFMAKLALGVGHNLLGSGFVETGYAGALREFLVSPDPENRKRQSIIFNSIWPEKGGYEKRLFQWQGGITLSITALGHFLVLHANIYGKHHLILMSPDREVWEKKIQFCEDGWVYVLVPERDICIGPLMLTEFIDHRTRIKRISELTDIENAGKDSGMENVRPMPAGWNR